MRPSLEAEIIELEKRIATLEKNKIGNLRREHSEIISTYEKMFDTLRFVNFNKVLMLLKINMIEIKSLEEDCSRECSKNQLIILLQKEMALCLMKMIQIGQEENSIMLESNERLLDKIRFKRLEVAKMKAEKDKLLNKARGGNKVIVHEKNINRYFVPEPFKCDIFSPAYDTAAYHPKILKMNRSRIPVLKLPLTSVVETVPFQIRKKPIKVSIPQDRLSVLKKPHSGRVVKPKNTHNGEKKIVPKSESYRLGERQNQQGKRAVPRKNSNNFTVINTKTKANVSSKNNNVMVANSENNSTPKSISKIPVRLNASSTKKSCSNKRKQDFPENLTPARSERNESDENHNKSINNYNKASVTVEDAAIVFKTLNDYCDKIEQIYGTSASNRSEHKLTQKRKTSLCNPCIPIKFRTDQKKVNSAAKTSIVVHSPVKYHESTANESLLSTSIDSTETGTTVIAAKSLQESVNGSSLNQDNQQNLCDSSPCLETFLSASKCFTPSNEEFRAGGDCFNSSLPGNFRYLDYESENSPNTQDRSAQYLTDIENRESPNSSYMINGKRRKSEIFHISFNKDRKMVNKNTSPSVFKIF